MGNQVRDAPRTFPYGGKNLKLLGKKKEVLGTKYFTEGGKGLRVSYSVWSSAAAGSQQGLLGVAWAWEISPLQGVSLDALTEVQGSVKGN